MAGWMRGERGRGGNLGVARVVEVRCGAVHAMLVAVCVCPPLPPVAGRRSPVRTGVGASERKGGKAGRVPRPWVAMDSQGEVVIRRLVPRTAAGRWAEWVPPISLHDEERRSPPSPLDRSHSPLRSSA